MFKIGYKVKILEGGSHGHCLEIGSIGEVVDVGHRSEFAIDIEGFSGWGCKLVQGIHPSELKIVGEESAILTDEEIQAIDHSTHFHESFDWSIRFARNVLKAAEEKKNG